MKKKTQQSDPSPYISLMELVEHWRCARSGIDRIARRAGMKRFYLGEGRNGIVRYLRKEVEVYEQSQPI